MTDKPEPLQVEAPIYDCYHRETKWTILGQWIGAVIFTLGYFLMITMLVYL